MANIKPFYSEQLRNKINLARYAIATQDYVYLNNLMADGLNPNIPDRDGRFLVHDAVLYDAEGTSLDILMHYHANVNARWSGYLNWTPAHIALFYNHMHVIEKLRRFGADLSLEDTRGWAPIRSLLCPITRFEAKKKLGGIAQLDVSNVRPDLVGHA